MRKECPRCEGFGTIGCILSQNQSGQTFGSYDCPECDGEGYVTVDPEEERGIANCLDEGEERDA